jgi:predicted Zn-dependent protease
MAPVLLRGAVAGALLCGVAACTGASRADLKPGEVPPADTVEAGLWMVMERAETQVRTSGSVIPDPALQSYVYDIACTLAGDHCGNLRVYVVRHPGFNASMAPNGFMVVWSGLLLRCENEDQLATVIGHEIAHYVRRHSIQRWETARNSLTGAQLFGVVTAGLGVPLGGFAMLGVYGHIQSFSRDNEREADAMGFALMEGGGYDPRQAAQIWRNLIDEKEAAEEEAPDPFFSSHPPSEERMATLTTLAEGSGKTPPASTLLFEAAVARHRAGWLEDEIDLGRYAEMQVVLDRMKASGHNPGIAWYYQGEALRRDGDVEDKSEALAAFRKSLEYPDAPALAHRGLGLLLQRQGDTAGARSAYQSYLAAAPDADDAAMIEFYMKNLEAKS